MWKLGTSCDTPPHECQWTAIFSDLLSVLFLINFFELLAFFLDFLFKYHTLLFSLSKSKAIWMVNFAFFLNTTLFYSKYKFKMFNLKTTVKHRSPSGEEALTVSMDPSKSAFIFKTMYFLWHSQLDTEALCYPECK